MSPREQGVASTTCPNCGNQLQLTELPDGGLAAQRCPSCYGPDPETAAAAVAPKSAPREKGTPVTKEEKTNG